MKEQKAEEVMTKEVITVTPDTRVIKAMEILTTNKISGLPVVDDDKNIIGIITETDMLNLFFDGHWHDTAVKEVMTQHVVSCAPNDSIYAVGLEISKEKFRRVPIVDEGKIVGIISRRDIINAVLKDFHHSHNK